MISVNWITKIIFVPKADLTLISGTPGNGDDLYEFDVNQFRLDLRDLEDSETGSMFLPTHNHNTTVTLSGVTYARVFEIINGYKVEFEDVGGLDGHYSVRCVGANHNIGDVKVVNSVSLIIGNSAGLIQVSSGSGLSADQADKLRRIWQALMLDPVNPVTTTPTEIIFDDVEIQLSGDPETAITGTRQ